MPKIKYSSVISLPLINQLDKLNFQIRLIKLKKLRLDWGSKVEEKNQFELIEKKKYAEFGRKNSLVLDIWFFKLHIYVQNIKNRWVLEYSTCKKIKVTIENPNYYIVY